MVEKWVLGNNEHILFVDDEESIATMIMRMLESLEYCPTIFTTCEEALEEVKNHPNKYELLITDMKMSGMDGVKLITEVKKINPAIKIIMCSGFADIREEIKDIANDIDSCLVKPLSIVQLSTTINEVLHNRIDGWIPIEEFEREPNEGWCWIVYKGRVVEAWRDYEGFFKFYPSSRNVYLRECITYAKMIERPEPPK